MKDDKHKAGKTRQKRKIHEITAENDIRYRGPLSYRHLKIAGWALIILGQVGLILSMVERYVPAFQSRIGFLDNIISYVSSLSVPILLLANFSVILNIRRTYKRLLKQYGIIVLVIIFLFVITYEHNIVDIAAAFIGTRTEAEQAISDLMGPDYLAFNLFMDLFLCTLFMYFLNGQPKKYFQGKKLIIFRLFALIPVLYELASIGAKILASHAIIRIPVLCYPLLTTKPPVTFLVFIILAIFIKYREKLYIRRGKTYEDYHNFLNTNVNSLQFSIFTAITFAVAAILDYLIMIILASVITGDLSAVPESDYDTLMYYAIEVANNWGFGQSIPLLLISPVILLFSYTRTHKKAYIDLLIPFGGIILIVLLYFEVFCRLLTMLPAILENMLQL